MKNQRRSFSIILPVIIAAIFAFSPCLRAQSNDSMAEGRKAIMEGAQRMMDGNKRIMAAVSKKGMKDPELEAAQKQMAEGYGMVVKGNGMMAGNTAQGQEMMKKGAKMMLDAQNMTTAIVKKMGLTNVCAIDLHECHEAKAKIEHGALMWYFGGAGGI